MEDLNVPIFNINDINDPRATRIIDCLYLGDEEASKDSMLLDELKIKRIVKVGQELEMKYPDKYDYMNIDIYDHNEENIYKHFESSFKFIDEAINKKESVLVHCKYGISRSTTIVVSYLIQKFGHRSVEACAFVSSKRSIINPNPGFLKQLDELDLRINSKFLEPKQFKKRKYTNLPIKTPYKKRNKASCRIKLKNEKNEKDVHVKETVGRLEDMSNDNELLYFFRILSGIREDLLHLNEEDQKKKILELIQDKNILTDLAFKKKQKISGVEKTRRMRILRKKLTRYVDKFIHFLYGSPFKNDLKSKLK